MSKKGAIDWNRIRSIMIMSYTSSRSLTDAGQSLIYHAYETDPDRCSEVHAAMKKEIDEEIRNGTRLP